MKYEHEIVTLVAALGRFAPSGFAIALHVRFAAPTYMFLTYPPEWREIYSQQGYVITDPTVQWGLAHTGYISWADLSQNDETGVLAHAAEFGMVHGICVAVDEGDSRSLASFNRVDRDYTPEETAEISQIFQQLHRVTSDLEQLSPQTNAALLRLSVIVTHP